MIRHLNLPGRPACLGLLLLLLGACSSNPPSTDKPSQQPAPSKPATPVTRPEPPPQPVEPMVSAHRQLLVKAQSATDRGDYESALAESSADLAYISLVNSEHAHWAERALERGLHVIVDKPAFLELEEAIRLLEFSRTQGLCLAEATVYTRHPQIETIRGLFDRPDGQPTSLQVNFSFPVFEAGNFRTDKALGGGALFDLGPYAVSPGRIFWGGRPDEIVCRTLSTDGALGVDTSFSVLMRYPEGRCLLGHFGFTTTYRNRLALVGPERSVELDRVFTTPENLRNELRIAGARGSSTLDAPAGDAFGLFIREVLRRIEARDLEGLRLELFEDAYMLDWMRRSAERLALRARSTAWTSTAQRTASSAVGNSASRLSPGASTTRPRCSRTSTLICSR